MAKCPKCRERKAKRHCPALEELICPPCCAEHRLKTISCPQDCPHLQAEFYQQARRKEKAKAHGREFITGLQRRFSSPEAMEFAFQISADCFWWMREHGTLSNGDVAAALEELHDSLSAVAIPSPRPHPLARFLKTLFASGRRYRAIEKRGLRSERRRRILEGLAGHVRALGDAAETSFSREVASYFGELDFESDLDYSPAEELEAPPDPRGAHGFEERPSGLIVPEP